MFGRNFVNVNFAFCRSNPVKFISSHICLLRYVTGCFVGAVLQYPQFGFLSGFHTQILMHGTNIQKWQLTVNSQQIMKSKLAIEMKYGSTVCICKFSIAVKILDCFHFLYSY